MQIFSLEEIPRDHTYAEAGVRGTWSEGSLCPECKGSTRRRIQPLVIEWEPDSDVLGDFTWGTPWSFAIVEHAMKALLAEFRGFEPGPVEMFQEPKLRRPTRITKRTKPRIWLPYEGPPLYDFWITARVHADMERSSIRLKKKCSTCGVETYSVTGLEERKGDWDLEAGTFLDVDRPRIEGQGIFVRQADLGGAEIFRLHELPGFILCTQRLKDFIEERRFTNVTFREVGDVV